MAERVTVASFLLPQEFNNLLGRTEPGNNGNIGQSLA